MDAKRKHQCPYCEKMTNCEELFSCREELYYDEAETDVAGEAVYYALRCLGCDRPFLERTSLCYDEAEFDDEGRVFAGTEIRTLPPLPERSAPRYSAPADLARALDGRTRFKSPYIYELHAELIKAVENCQPILTAMGLRSLIDAVAVEFAGGSRKEGFAAHLELLENTGRISAEEAKLFKKIVDMGSGATHRQDIPDEEDNLVCLKAVDHLLESVIVQPQRARLLGAGA